MAYSLAKLDELKNDLLATRPSFDQMALKHVDFAKEMEFAIQAFQSNEYLLKMTPDSIKNCLINVALSGLTLSPVMKMAYLVPRKGKLCLDPSYMGMIKIVTDTGSVKSLKSDVAYEKDTFDIELGSKGFVKHKPFLGIGDRGRRLGAYSIAVLNDGTEHIDFMRWDEIMAIKTRSESVKSGKQSPWDSDPDEMACKTVVKRHYKYLPKSDRAIMASQVIAFDDEANGIDFEQEHKEKQATAGQQAGATPEAPPADAMATDDDYKQIMDGLLDPALAGVTKFHGADAKEGFGQKQMYAGVWKKMPANGGAGIEKSKADEYIKFVKEQVEYFKSNPVNQEKQTADEKS